MYELSLIFREDWNWNNDDYSWFFAQILASVLCMFVFLKIYKSKCMPVFARSVAKSFLGFKLHTTSCLFSQH